MRIAICISGHVRDYKKFSQSFFEKIIEPNKHHEIDVFISTWDKINTGSSFASTRRGYIDDNKVDVNEIVRIYNPKLYIVEKSNDSIFERFNITNHNNNPKFVISQFYKINQVGNLLKYYIQSTGRNYDLVMKTRFDINYDCIEDVDVNLPKPEITTKTFKFENFDSNFFNVEHDWDHYQNWVHDKIFVSNVNNYLKFIDIFNNFENILQKYGTPTAEHLIYFWLISQNVPIKKTFDLRVLGWQNT